MYSANQSRGAQKRELMKYPIAYLSEPGYWVPSDAEAEGLRRYLAKGGFLGIHQDNDRSKRLMVIINYNNDIGDYMEHSGQGWWPVNTSNDAYKLAINYIVYGLTH